MTFKRYIFFYLRRKQPLCTSLIQILFPCCEQGSSFRVDCFTCSKRFSSLFPGLRRSFLGLAHTRTPARRGVASLNRYAEPCGPKGYDFSTVWVINRISILDILVINRLGKITCFSHKQGKVLGSGRRTHTRFFWGATPPPPLPLSTHRVLITE